MREKRVVAIHPLIGSLKTRSGMEPVPRCEPSTYQPISRWHNHCAIGAGILKRIKNLFNQWVVLLAGVSVQNRGKERKGNVLFNDALNTFYLRLYGVRHMVKDHSDSDRGNTLPPHRLLFPISSKELFYMHHPTDRIIHTTAFATPVVEHWLERVQNREAGV